jgi:hypothetical protein
MISWHCFGGWFTGGMEQTTNESLDRTKTSVSENGRQLDRVVAVSAVHV